MKKVSLILATISLIAFSSCKNEQKKETENSDKEMVTKKETAKEVKEEITEIKEVDVKLEPRSDSKLSGNVIFTEKEGKVTLNAHIKGLEKGEYAMHIHEKADCSAADGTSSGGHWNPTFEDHGKWGSEDGYHKGDIGNFEIDENGHGSISMTTDEWCIGCNDKKKNIIGKAIIIHSGKDDYKTQPTGNAGSRVGCGEIIQ